MTDLISSLADSIVALINSKSASPTKEEVASVVHAQLADAVLGIGSYPFFKPAKDRAEEIKRQREFLTQQIAGSAIVHVFVSDCQAEAPSVSQAMLDAMDAIRKSSYEPGRAQHMLPCPGSTTGSHYYNPHCTNEGDVFYRCGICGATKP